MVRQGPAEPPAPPDGFDEFVRTRGERLRTVLVAQFGFDEGCDLAAKAMAYAFEHWDSVSAMANPAGYVYRVAQNAGRKRYRWRRRPAVQGPEAVPAVSVRIDPEVQRALAALRPAHRASVVLVHAFGWSYGDVAEALDVPITTVRNHVHRGMAVLRHRLGGRADTGGHDDQPQ